METLNRRDLLKTGLVGLVLGIIPNYTESQQPQTKSKQQKQYTQSELLYTQEEFEKHFEHPKDNSALLRKTRLIHENPKQAFKYLPKEQQVEITELYNSLRNPETKKPSDTLIKNSYKSKYPFINTKKPEFADALIIYLHEKHLSKYSEKPIKSSF